MNSNYPNGADMDLSAPYNSITHCPACGNGSLRSLTGNIYECVKCGYIEQDGKELTDFDLLEDEN